MSKFLSSYNISIVVNNQIVFDDSGGEGLLLFLMMIVLLFLLPEFIVFLFKSFFHGSGLSQD